MVEVIQNHHCTCGRKMKWWWPTVAAAAVDPDGILSTATSMICGEGENLSRPWEGPTYVVSTFLSSRTVRTVAVTM
jgi:hypothetical protein